METGMGLETEIILLLIVIISVAMGTRYYSKLPYTIALIFAGLILSFFHVFPDIRLTPDLIFHMLLPPLLFEAAFNLNFNELKENIKSILTYAVFGVLIAVIVTGFLLQSSFSLFHLDIQMTLIACLLFGAVISSTDPISVLAIFKQLGAPKRLSAIIEGESLFNDGISVVVYGIILSVAVSHSEFTMGHGLEEFVRVAFGGVITGVIVGLIFSKLASLIDDHLIEITITTVVTYLAYFVAEYFEVSGVISVIVAGLTVGNYGTKEMSATTKVSLRDFWEYVAFLVNSVVFIIIGLEVGIVNIFSNFQYIVIAIVSVLIGRSVSVLVLTQFINRFDKKITFKWQLISIWGGVRGALAMALALAIPEHYEYREIILIMTFGVVGFSLIVQGLSIGVLLRFLHIGGKDKSLESYELEKGKLIALQSASSKLEEMYKNGVVSSNVYNLLSKKYSNEVEKIKSILEEVTKEVNIKNYELTSSLKRLLLKEKSAIQDAAKQGIIEMEIAEALIRDINEEMILLENNLETA